MHVRGPQYQQIWVSVGIVALPGQVPTLVQQAVTAAVQAFLSPLTGGLPTQNAGTGILAADPAGSGSGWPLGTNVRSQDIEAVATRVPGVRYVDSVLIAGVGADGTVVASVDPVPITGLQLPAATVFVNSGAGRRPGLADRRQPARPAHPGTRPRRPPGLLIPMDVQGSQFHLINGRDDWGRCTDSASPGSRSAAAWADQADSPSSAARTSLEYDETRGALRLRHDLPLFRRAGRIVPLDPVARRGAGRDAYGNWYWIDDDQTSIRWRPADDDVSAPWWSSAHLDASCADAEASVFSPVPPAAADRAAWLAWR